MALMKEAKNGTKTGRFSNSPTDTLINLRRRLKRRRNWCFGGNGAAEAIYAQWCNWFILENR